MNRHTFEKMRDEALAEYLRHLKRGDSDLGKPLWMYVGNLLRIRNLETEWKAERAATLRQIGIGGDDGGV